MEPWANPRKDLAGSAALALVALGYLLLSARLPMETLANPGPAVFPLGVGLLLLGLAGGRAVQALLRLRAARRAARPHARGRPLEGEPAAVARADGAPTLLMLLLILYGALVNRIGFLALTFLLVVASSKLMGARGWARPLALALGIVASCYLLFVAWLKVPFPKGILP
jgi:hypothetical protein